MNRVYGEKIGRSMGKVEAVDVDEKDIGWGHCMRIKIYIDLTRPLARGTSATVKGEKHWVSFKYEKLPKFCFKCGCIIHNPSKGCLQKNNSMD